MFLTLCAGICLTAVGQMLSQQGEPEGEESEVGFILSTLLLMPPQSLLYDGGERRRRGHQLAAVPSILGVRKVFWKEEEKGDTQPREWVAGGTQSPWHG